MKKFYTSFTLPLIFSFVVLLSSNRLAAQHPGVMESLSANNNFNTAMPVSSPVKVRGNIFPVNDVDYYSFTAQAGDKVFAATMTNFSSGGGNNSTLTLYASNGTTVIETDADDGTLAAASSSIAGATIPAAGTYFLRISEATAGSTERGYDLYLNVVSGVPVPEVETNNTPATATTVPVSGYISGTRGDAIDSDFFAITLSAGESVFLSLDLDPERDAVSWAGRLGFGLFGDALNQVPIVDDPGDAELPLIPSEAMFFTVKDAGTYYIFIDGVPATGDATHSYHLAVARFAAQTGYVNYPSVDIPKTIGPGNTIVSSSIIIPDVKRIKDISIRVTLSHDLMSEVDAILTTPTGQRIALFTDIGASSTGGQTQMDLFFNDHNAIPPSFTVLKGMGYNPEPTSKLNQLAYTNSVGTWTLTLYDDVDNTSGGVLTAWSIDILEETVPLVGSILAYENFELSDGGFTHSGAGDEWEYGLPATVAAPGVAPFTTAGSGTKAWKTDLDGNYEPTANQTLVSPVYDLTLASGALYMGWTMMQQMENAAFDGLSIYAEEEPGGSGLILPLYTWLGATQTVSPGSPAVSIGMSGGWGAYYADISAMAGKRFRFKVQLTSDGTVQMGGVAIDDVTVFAAAAVVPVYSNNLTGFKQGTVNKLRWKVTCSNEPGAIVTLQRSANATRFDDIHTQTITAARCELPFDYTDAATLHGKNYYRVKMVSATGQTTYSNVVLLLNHYTGLELMNIAPNPVTGSQFNVNISSAVATAMQFIITDVQGKVVSTQQATLIAGHNTLAIFAGNLGAGTYFIQGITGTEKTAAIKLFKK